MEVSDYTGRTLKAGQRVAYPRRNGSSMWLAQGVVRSVIAGMYDYDSKVLVDAESSDNRRRSGKVPSQRCIIIG